MDGAEAEAAAARAAEQARIRKERRAAKIRAGGSARLNKITGLSGRSAEPEHPAPAPAASISEPTASSQSSAPLSEDPAEVDISNHFYEPTRTARAPILSFSPTPAGAAAGEHAPALSEEQLRSLMLGMDPAVAAGTPAPGFSGPAPQGAGLPDADPLAMLQQMLGGAGGPAGAGMGPGMFAGMQQQQQEAASTPASRSAALFRVLHVLFALSLGLFIALKTPFTGALSQRLDPSLDFSALSAGPGSADAQSADSSGSSMAAVLAGRSPADLLWVFATGEALLLSARYAVEKRTGADAAGVPGVLGTVLAFVPSPIGGYVRLAMRYGQFFMAVRNDVMLSVFVLGVCAWAKA
ncbi:hypothetical protein BROUX41_000307 [Berkeleyomyces rouxiae]|uniref:uncharacterized protein n=1 Tax=Berkeleyomyces rouxiae TaxID=2035830 RepID=UPI003B820F71